MPYRPPEASLPKLAGIDFAQAVEVLQNWKRRFDAEDASSDDPSKCQGLLRFPDGTLFYEAKAAICADGWSGAVTGDETGQRTTSVPLTGGKNPVYFDATKIPYVVLPKNGFETDARVAILDLGMAIYKDRVCPVIFCDRGPANKIGELSIRAHEVLGHDPWRDASHTHIKNSSIEEGVLYFVFPGSRITHPTLTEDNVNSLIIERVEARWAQFSARAVPPDDRTVEVRGIDPTDIRQLQERLSAAGLYDRAAIDGRSGPFTEWALNEFKKIAGTQGEAGLGPETAGSLENAENTLALEPGDDLAGRIVQAMQRAGHWICRHEQCLNIVYVEGMDREGEENENIPNQFNDTRFLIGISDGVPTVVAAWEGSTEPGRLFTEHPLDDAREKGAARVQFGQYYAWTLGFHHSDPNHEALVQVGDITVCRDLNKDYQRNGDRVETGVFGINQHWGYDLPFTDMQNSGAGCLIGRTKAGHRQFMSQIKQDARYVASHGYRFTTTILPASAV